MSRKSEAAEIREKFWTTLGRYMAPVPSEEGLKINWINYKTRVPGLQFKLRADHKKASVVIAINHRDPDIKELLFEQLITIKSIMVNELGDQWQWPKGQQLYNNEIEITQSIFGVNIYSEEDWPELIRFFKEQLIALDGWWSMANIAFEDFKR